MTNGRKGNAIRREQCRSEPTLSPHPLPLTVQIGGYGLVEIMVVDTGIGIGAEAHATIFDGFQQADPSIARKYGGTGLGMTIVKRLVEAMHGDIWIKSELGKGTTFMV